MYKAIFQIQVIKSNGQEDGGVELTLGLAGEGVSIDKAILQGLVQVKKISDTYISQGAAH